MRLPSIHGPYNPNKPDEGGEDEWLVNTEYILTNSIGSKKLFDRIKKPNNSILSDRSSVLSFKDVYSSYRKNISKNMKMSSAEKELSFMYNIISLRKKKNKSYKKSKKKKTIKIRIKK